jgi:hypothetical protein
MGGGGGGGKGILDQSDLVEEIRHLRNAVLGNRNGLEYRIGG